MASPENVTNEKTAEFEDEDYDPDLEARLYAEIYYSNETYVPDNDPSIANIEETSNVGPNAGSTSTSSKIIEADLASSNIGSTLPTDNFVEDCRPDKNIISGHRQLDIGKSYYPTQNWVSEEHLTRESDKRQSDKPTLANRQRLLAHKGLWLTPEKTGKNRAPIDRRDATPKRNNSSAVEVHFKPPKSIQKPKFITIQEDRVIITKSCPLRQSVRLQSIQAKKAEEKKAKIKERRERKRNLKQGLTPERQGKNSNDAGIIEDASKYRVVSKKRKLKIREMNTEPVNISSDSDDSILEVPVPPKAPPVIIQLPDSDDDCEKSDKTCSKKSNESVVERTDESAACESIETEASTSNLEASAGRSSLSSNNDISNEARKNARITCEVFVEPPCPEENTLILNCTEIQRGASSLDEIRRIRETVPSIHTHSDDSMTESEANNWGNLAAGQSDIGRAEEICSNELSNDAVNSELWNQLRQESPSAAGLPTETLSSSAKASPVGRTSAYVDRDSNESMTKESATTTKKRQKDVAYSSFTDFDVPAIPEKRSKRSKDKSTREESLTDYFFKPMSKELQAFYNNPWGGENMDVYDIQSRMPKNPRCWTILDADLQGPASKRRRACPRCKTDTHYGKRCPEKPKAPCCYMCGDKGHNESRCPRTMCLTCGRRYSTYRPTCGYCSKLYCNRCNGSGHINTNCPDLWRRYHNTTTETIPIAPRDTMNIMKSPQYLTCCNCAKRGHDVSMCRQLRWSQHFPTPVYVSNYADGPFYPSFHHEQTTDTVPREDLTDEPPQQEPIVNSNPNNVPIYLAPTEKIGDSCPEEDIETPESHRGDAPDNEPPNPIQSRIPTENVIFQYENLGPHQTADLHIITKRLDTMTDVHLDGLLAGRLVPNFVSNWQHLFAFSIRITQDSVNAVYIVIEAKTVSMLKGLEKLMFQWLTRKDDEKPNLEYDTLRFNVDQIAKHIGSKIVLLNNVLDPVVLFKKVIACEEDLKHMVAKMNRTKNETRKKMARRKRFFEKQVLLVTTRRSQLVTSLYGRSWVKGGHAIVGFFRAMAQKIKRKSKITLRQYLDLVHVNNEIFTFHTNEALSAAMDKAILASRESNSANALVPQASTVATSEPQVETVGGNNVNGEKSVEDPPILPTVDSRCLPDYSSPLALNRMQQITIIEDRGTETSEIPAIFGMIGSQVSVAMNSNDGANTINFQENSKTPFPIPLERSNLRNDLARPKAKNSSILPRGRVKNRDVGLLRNLTKRNRKLYKCAAREVIKLANTTNKPHLQKMAKELKLKIGNGSITTNDVHMLQKAVGVPLKQHLVNQPSQDRNSLRNNYDNTYEAFLRDL